MPTGWLLGAQKSELGISSFTCTPSSSDTRSFIRRSLLKHFLSARGRAFPQMLIGAAPADAPQLGSSEARLRWWDRHCCCHTWSSSLLRGSCLHGINPGMYMTKRNLKEEDDAFDAWCCLTRLSALAASRCGGGLVSACLVIIPELLELKCCPWTLGWGCFPRVCPATEPPGPCSLSSFEVFQRTDVLLKKQNPNKY